MAKHSFEYDDVTRTITGPGHLVNAVYKLVSDANQTEHVRQERWWATYNAVMTGMLARVPWNVTAVDEEKFHKSASEFADRAHGKVAP